MGGQSRRVVDRSARLSKPSVPSGLRCRRFGSQFNPADNLLLNQTRPRTRSSPASVAAVRMPTTLEPTRCSTLSAPFPQFSTITLQNPATGNTWYDSMQVKATHRLSPWTAGKWCLHVVEVADFDPPELVRRIEQISCVHRSVPFLFNVNILYTTQTWFGGRKMLNTITKDWNWRVPAVFQRSACHRLPPPARIHLAPTTPVLPSSIGFRATRFTSRTSVAAASIRMPTSCSTKMRGAESVLTTTFGPAAGTFYSELRRRSPTVRELQRIGPDLPHNGTREFQYSRGIT